MKSDLVPKGVRLGILGGTFNPIHNAHLAIAEAARVHFRLDEVVFVPAHTPPHKGVLEVSTEQRLQMLRIGLNDTPFSVSTIELDREGVSYTVDTVRALGKARPEAELCFIIGDDSLVQLHSWKSIAELLGMCRFLTVSRPGVDVAALRENLHLSEETIQQLLADRIEACNLGTSSTMIRERVRTGRSIQRLVPAPVAEYIEENKIYLS